MHSQNSIVDSCKIDGLIVSAYDSDLKIQLTSTFTRDVLPANRAHIPTGEMARSLPHGIKVNDEHYEMPSTFNGSDPTLPNNKAQAIQRFNHLRKRLRNDARYRNGYLREEILMLRSLGSEGPFEANDSVKARNNTMKWKYSLYKLDPFLDQDGIIRVGGRIRRADLSSDMKHLIILPKNSHITELIMPYFHEQSFHQGRGITTNTIRSHGYRIIGCSSAVSNPFSKCVTCRKLRSQTQVQKMADLPVDRLETVPPFTYCGVDLFGPWLIKEGRKELRFLCTCLSPRSIHIETANALDTSSFINALRRLVSIRGPVRHLRCDQGTYFIGAEGEFNHAMSEFDFDRSVNIYWNKTVILTI
ncbi:unnamed protein product [Mytilus coruscus]|uniref:Integrase catalytic domain-containing protein n=1 Tax=Mytilus coruscus TaxID=42192 RepID=A0A6J8CQ36_MYTCO|nr:unnamed protein product [Mytilus coruscus]